MAADPRGLFAVGLFAVAVAGCAYPRSQGQSAADDLGGTSWQLVKFQGGDDLPFIRSYIKKDGRLFLSLMADGGIYEFEPGP